MSLKLIVCSSGSSGDRSRLALGRETFYNRPRLNRGQPVKHPGTGKAGRGSVGCDLLLGLRSGSEKGGLSNERCSVQIIIKKAKNHLQGRPGLISPF